MKKVLLNIAKTLVLPVALYVLFLILNANFGNVSLLTSPIALNQLYRNTLMTTILAYGASYNLSSGRFDFSLGSVWLLSGITAVNLSSMLNFGPVGVVVIAMILGAILASGVAGAYLLLRVPTIVVALGVLLIYEAVTTAVFGGDGANASQVPGINVLVSPFVLLGIFAVVFLAMFIINNYTVFGYHSRALAQGQKVAVRTGISEKKNVVVSWIISGICCGIAVSLNIASVGVLVPASNFGSSSTLTDVLLPVMLGNFLGGFSEPTVGILVGTLSVQVLKAGLNALQIDPNLLTICVIMFLFIYIMYTSMKVEVERNHALKKRAMALLKAQIPPQ